MFDDDVDGGGGGDGDDDVLYRSVLHNNILLDRHIQADNTERKEMCFLRKSVDVSLASIPVVRSMALVAALALVQAQEHRLVLVL